MLAAIPSTGARILAGASEPDLIVDSVTLDPTNPAQGIPVGVTLTVRNAGGNCTAPCFFTVDFYQHLASPPAPQQFGDIFCALDIPLAGQTVTCTDQVTYSQSGSQQAWAQVDADEIVPEANEANNVLGPILVQVLSDWDGDGVTNAADNCPYYANASQTLPPWPVAAEEDYDCDGWTRADEKYFGTDETVACGFTAGGDLDSDNWPVDLFESNSINTTDVLQLRPVFMQSVPPASTRFDLFPSGSINTTDVLQLRPFFMMSCTP